MISEYIPILKKDVIKIIKSLITELPIVIYILSLDLSSACNEFDNGISIKYINMNGANTFM